MPIDIGSIAAVTTWLQSAGEIMKAIVGRRDGAMTQPKVIELNAMILTAQMRHFRQTAISLRCWIRYARLKKIVDLKAWDA
jgi:hypothetical protein